jgi:hypothetical protein
MATPQGKGRKAEHRKKNCALGKYCTVVDVAQAIAVVVALMRVRGV